MPVLICLIWNPRRALQNDLFVIFEVRHLWQVQFKYFVAGRGAGSIQEHKEVNRASPGNALAEANNASFTTSEYMHIGTAAPSDKIL